MSTVVLATSAADAQAVEAVKDHHAQLAGALAVQVETLIDAADRGDLPGAVQPPRLWSAGARPS